QAIRNAETHRSSTTHAGSEPLSYASIECVALRPRANVREPPLLDLLELELRFQPMPGEIYRREPCRRAEARFFFVSSISCSTARSAASGSRASIACTIARCRRADRGYSRELADEYAKTVRNTAVKTSFKCSSSS